MPPRVFISYSWSSPEHQEFVRDCANRLPGDGVDVIFDLFDLREGNDTISFMERMSTDQSITHVLIFSDRIYAEKADARKAGVGKESQIISQEIYDKIGQSKFIPISCETDDNGNHYLPVFLKSRKWINFSTPQEVSNNWEQLIRVLFGKPQYIKPPIGPPPLYITNDSPTQINPVQGCLNTFKQAYLGGKPGINMYRRDFLDSCVAYADSLRIRVPPSTDKWGEKVLADCTTLKTLRNNIVDWVLLEAGSSPSESFQDSIILLLEKIHGMTYRPIEVTSYNDSWFDAHGVFAREVFLYIIAGLIRTSAFPVLHTLLTTHYFNPDADQLGVQRFARFDCFYRETNSLQILAPEGRRLLSPTAELYKRNADRSDLPFSAIAQAELLIALMVMIDDNLKWCPSTLYYSSNPSWFPFFAKASQRKHFTNLATVVGIPNADLIREKAGAGKARIYSYMSNQASFNIPLWKLMNMDDLDKLQ